MNSKKRLLILTHRPLHNGPRMIREIEAFKNHFTIFTIGLTPATNTELIYKNINELLPFSEKIINKLFKELFLKKIIPFIYERYHSIARYIIKNKIDIVIAHEPHHLPFLIKLRNTVPIKIVYNAHEYHPLEFDDKPEWLKTYGRYYHKIYMDCLPKLDLLVNVSFGIAQKCEDEYGVTSLVVPNAALYSAIPPSVNSENTIKMVFHGGIIASRKIEEMIKMTILLGEGYSLDIVASVPKNQISYFNYLKELAKQTNNISFVDIVPFDQIIPLINKYDIGIYILPDISFNNKYALPNKFFEYIQAKLAIAIAPSIEMKRILNKYDLGVVSEDFSPESLAKTIKALHREKIQQYKNNSIEASKIESSEEYHKSYLNALLLFK